MRCKDADAEWFCVRYKNNGRIEEYLGDTQPYFVEVIAVRFSQWLNGSLSLDWSYENWITSLVRETGPGFRVGFIFTAAYIVLFSTLFLDTPLLFQYDIHHPNSDMRFGDVTLIVTFYLWTLDFGLLTLSYYLVRHYGTPAQNGECTPFFRVSTRQLREHRAREPKFYTYLVRALFAILFIVHFALGTISLHTILSHMYVKRNVYFAILLCIKMFMAVMASTDDLTNIGSPWGIQESSKTASALLSFRGLFLVPLTVIWSVASIAASFPPSYCEEC